VMEFNCLTFKLSKDLFDFWVQLYKLSSVV
jgi:hypothetical protein